MISVLERLDPAVTHGASSLYLGYTGLRADVLRFFSHAPRDLAAAAPARSAHAFPRERLAGALQAHNVALGAPPATMASIAALREPRSLCVVTGQQAGFLGGPLYTAYKIATTIRVARELAASTGLPVLPVFWLASEDHDFQEINHAYALRDGVARRVSFAWPGAGRPISDLPMSREVRLAFERYGEEIGGTLGAREAMQLLEADPNDSYCSWISRVLLRLFGAHGLVVVEPRILAPLAGSFFEVAFSRTHAIRESLRSVSHDLAGHDLAAALDPEQAGVPFRFTPEGMRVRCPADPSLARSAAERPELYSTDAALRPILQDALLPTAVSVLGPGEISYQAMLRPLYELFGVPQPLLLPRMTLTVMSEGEADLLSRFRLDFARLRAPDLDAWDVLKGLIPKTERGRFDAAARDVEAAFHALTEHVASVDPNLRRTATAAHETARRALERVERRSFRALLARQGLSVAALSGLRAALFPFGSLQERVFPLPFLLQRHGSRIVDELVEVGSPMDFRHLVAVAGSR